MRGARLAPRPGDGEHVAVVAFVAIGRSRDNQLAHAGAREELDARTLDRFENVRRNADIGDDDIARTRLGGRQHQRQLRCRQRHGHAGFDRIADRIGRIGGQSRRQIDGHNRNAGGVDIRDDAFDEPADGRVQAGAEHCVDDERAVAYLGEVQLPCLAIGDLDYRESEAAEDFEVRTRIAAHVGDAAHEKHRHVDTPLEQRAGDHEAVAAVVAASAEHGHLELEQIAVHRLHRGDHLTAGVFHQNQWRDADFLDRAAIGFAHLCGVEYAHRGYSQG